MTLSPNTQNTALLTALHLMVDGLCACSVFTLQGSLVGMGVAVLFVTYNVLAFMTQPFVGIWMDRRRPGSQCLWTAALLLLTGALLTTLHPLCRTLTAELPLLVAVAVLLGMGNSLFHVYGGKFVTEHTANDPRHLGFFVSSGALGLALGGACHSLALMVIIALLMIAAIIAFERVSPAAEGAQSITLATPEPRSCALLLFMLLLVFGRSFVGNVRPDSVANLSHYAVIAGLLAFVGKSSGGFLGRRFGVWSTLTLTLTASGLCLLLSGLHWAFAVLMVLAINLTMPLTLHLANRSMPRRAGFAFGALAFVLIPGHALALCCGGLPSATFLLYALVATIIIEALVLLSLGERRWQVLGASVAMNVLTNVPLNLAVSHVAALQNSLAAQIALELVVLAIETALFWLVVRRRRMAFTYALACNVTSYLCGVIFGLVFASLSSL